MKRLFIFILSLITIVGHAQTIRRVNNSGATGVNVYSTLQTAHDAAAANDILIVDPNTVSYGDLTLTKPVKIYGNGYFLSINTELKADMRNSTVGALNFNAGSAGSAVYGLTASATWYVNGVSNITIQRNYLSALTFTSASATSSNIAVVGNYIVSSITLSNASFTISNVNVSNNQLAYIIAPADPIVQNWIVRNNVITSQQSIGSSAIFLVNSIFENNIVFTTGGGTNNTNCAMNYNISNSNNFSGGTGNQNSYPSLSSEFITLAAGISPDENFQLKPGSPLKTAGSAGSEVGMYGGLTPYVVSGIAAIPSITGLVNTATGSNSVPLQVTISVKSNN